MLILQRLLFFLIMFIAFSRLCQIVTSSLVMFWFCSRLQTSFSKFVDVKSKVELAISVSNGAQVLVNFSSIFGAIVTFYVLQFTSTTVVF